MSIEAPLPGDTRSKLADWVEVASLIRARGAGSGDLAGLYGADIDSERELQHDEFTGDQLESEILDEGRALFTEQVLAEVEYRRGVLGTDYPFVLDGRGSQWRLFPAPCSSTDQQCAARCCYVFCLLASALRDKCVCGMQGDDLKRAMERLFQAVAVDAAAALMNGAAISFGWPRPEGTKFRAALKDACGQLGLGEPLKDMPAWSKGHEKGRRHRRDSVAGIPRLSPR